LAVPLAHGATEQLRGRVQQVAAHGCETERGQRARVVTGLFAKSNPSYFVNTALDIKDWH
jgi:hypothetical protein